MWTTTTRISPTLDGSWRSVPCRSSQGVRPHQRVLHHRFCQLLVPGARREDPRFRLFALTNWPAFHRAGCCLAISP